MLPFKVEDLEAAVAAGDVTARPHPTAPYKIYNYSPETQFSKKWNDVTLNCRGLILNEKYGIVARPWKKFFNLGEVELPIQLTDSVEVMDKADGSLGILYPTFDYEERKSDWAIATRGSFMSEQAIKATAIFNEKYGDYSPMYGYTMLFEIVYPQNRIVLDYGDMEDLILLGAVENHTGFYIGPQAASSMWWKKGESDWVQQPPKPRFRKYAMWGGPVVKVHDYNTISDALGKMGRKNEEGYVIRSHNFMVKVKEPDYLDLHRLVTNCSPKTVWEQLKSGKSKDEIVSAFPDEFHKMVEDFIDPLMQQFADRSKEIHTAYSEAVTKVITKHGAAATRADFARVFSKHEHKKFFFLLLDSKPIREVLWASLRPTVDKEQ